MPSKILTNTVASITELKINPMATVKAAGGEAIAILNRNEPAFYCVPAKLYADLLDQIGGNVQYKQELDQVAKARVYCGEDSVGATFSSKNSKQEIEQALFGEAL